MVAVGIFGFTMKPFSKHNGTWLIPTVGAIVLV